MQSPYLKLISDNKAIMESISSVESPESFHELGRRLRVIGDRYPLMGVWQDWVARLDRAPAPGDLDWISPEQREQCDTMGRDLWTILGVKVKGTSRMVVDSVAVEGILWSPLLRASRVWYQLLRDSSGRLRNRRLLLTQSVTSPPRVSTWSEIPIAIRKWEMEVVDLYQLTGSRLDNGIMIQSILNTDPT